MTDKFAKEQLAWAGLIKFNMDEAIAKVGAAQWEFDSLKIELEAYLCETFELPTGKWYLSAWVGLP